MMTTDVFQQLITQHMPGMKTFAYRFTRNLEDSEDLVQDTVIRALQNFQRYQQGTNFKAWVLTIMRNTFINDYRSQQKWKPIIQVVEDLSLVGQHSSSSKNKAVSQLIMGDIHSELAKLPRLSRIAFLAHFEGYKYEEIATALELPVGTIKTRIHLARKALRKGLETYRSKM